MCIFILYISMYIYLCIYLYMYVCIWIYTCTEQTLWNHLSHKQKPLRRKWKILRPDQSRRKGCLDWCAWTNRRMNWIVSLGFHDRPRKRKKKTWVLLRVVNSDLLRYVDPLYLYNIQKIHVHEYVCFFIDVLVSPHMFAMYISCTYLPFSKKNTVLLQGNQVPGSLQAVDQATFRAPNHLFF